MQEVFLRRTIQLSIEKMLEDEGGPFGAVVVRQGEIVGEGWNRVTSLKDPTAHAEIVAIRNACRSLGTFTLRGCQLYASCEPCPMCLAAIYWARIDRLYYAASSEDAAAAGFDDRFIYDQLTCPHASRALTIKQALRSEALRAFDRWIKKEDRLNY
jgi:tRNA(Arg) A34 adenosine deaminase TadA